MMQCQPHAFTSHVSEAQHSHMQKIALACQIHICQGPTCMWQGQGQRYAPSSQFQAYYHSLLVPSKISYTVKTQLLLCMRARDFYAVLTQLCRVRFLPLALPLSSLFPTQGQYHENSTCCRLQTPRNRLPQQARRQLSRQVLLPRTPRVPRVKQRLFLLKHRCEAGAPMHPMCPHLPCHCTAQSTTQVHASSPIVLRFPDLPTLNCCTKRNMTALKKPSIPEVQHSWGLRHIINKAQDRL